VDTLGLLLVVVVHSAAIQDRDGAKLVFLRLMALRETLLPRLCFFWADGGYAGKLLSWVTRLSTQIGGWILEIVKRTDDMSGFVLLPRRWVVERTFGWLSKYRRLSKDYEENTKSSEAWIQLAMIHIMVRRLAT
jgi:putative transposase